MVTATADFMSRELGAARWFLFDSSAAARPQSLACLQGATILEKAAQRIQSEPSLFLGETNFNPVQLDASWKTPLGQIVASAIGSGEEPSLRAILVREEADFLLSNVQDRQALTKLIVWTAYYWNNQSAALQFKQIELPPDPIPFAMRERPAAIIAPDAPTQPVVYPWNVRLRLPGVNPNGPFPTPLQSPTAVQLKPSQASGFMWGVLTTLGLAGTGVYLAKKKGLLF